MAKSVSPVFPQLPMICFPSSLTLMLPWFSTRKMNFPDEGAWMEPVHRAR